MTGLILVLLASKPQKTEIDFQNIVSGKLEIIFGKTIEASVLCPTQER